MVARLFLCAALCAGFAVQAATVYGPVPYTSAADNPVGGVFSYSHLENFEDRQLNTPGVSASGGVAISASGRAIVDSVDGDDGSIDGSGANGHSYFSNRLTSITFTFSAAGLGGSLPSVVGLAFTDVGGLRSSAICCFADANFEAFDGTGASLGVVTLAQFGDGAATSGTAEDRFVAVRHAGGISMLTVGFTDSSDWEVDHLFYALDATTSAVPEPGSLCATRLARRRR